MFCQDCGFENTQGLNYCKRCGQILNPNVLSNHVVPGGSPLVTAIFLIAICAVTIAGFTVPVMALAELHDKVHQGALLFFATIILGAVVGIDAMLIHLFTKYLGLSKTQLKMQQPRRQRPKSEVGESAHARLSEPPFAVPSVTEHTTRNFEPIAEKQARETS